MGFVKSGVSAIGKLLIVVALAAAFLVGLLGVVYLSLRGDEIRVPEIVGKDRSVAEKELTALGLKIKKRADRYSQEKPNTILEQSPKAGTTAKTGQQILVVVSQLNPDSSEEAPATVEKDDDDDSSGGDSDKPKKTNKNANVKKPVQTTRDVNSNKVAKESDSSSGGSDPANTSKSNTGGTSNITKPGQSNPAEKPTTKTPAQPTNSPKPSPVKTPTGGDTRSRKIANQSN